MTVSLTGNFLATARCLIYQDGNAITWSFNPNTNQLTAAYTGAGSAGSHNPTATIGLSAVNGTATTWMTSDSAPPLSQGIVPTWTGAHTFNNGIVFGATSTLTDSTGAVGTSAQVLSSTVTGVKWVTGGGSTGANPTASIGLTAVNGTATTFLRSDGAPALSQAIVPLWSGQHTFNCSSAIPCVSGNNTSYPAFGAYGGVGYWVNTAGAVALGMNSNGAHTGQIFGSGNTGFCLGYGNNGVTVGTAVLTWTGAGGVQIGAPTGGDKGVGTLNVSSGYYVNGTALTTVTSANPSASVGLSAVNGTATTFMTSDSAPPLSQAIAPTWTGIHTYSVTPVLNAGAQVANAQVLSWLDSGGTARTVLQMYSDNNVYFDNTAGGALKLRTNSNSNVWTFANAGTLACPGAVGVNGATPPAKVTGWGTPTGQTVVNNFAAGVGTTVLQMSEAIAQIITDLKAFGLYGA